jgi:hypothetical protein
LIWDKMQACRPDVERWFVLCRSGVLPPGLTLAQLFELFGELVSRHESLRTLFHIDGAGELIQQVLDGGTIDAIFVDARDQWSGDELITELERQVTATDLDNDTELPIRAAIGLRDGAPVAFTIGVSHLCADDTAMQVLEADVARMFAAMAASRPMPPRPVAWQPADQARFEHSPEGTRQAAVSLAELRDRLSTVPPRLFDTHADAESTRYWRGELRTASVPAALHTLAARHRSMRSPVLLAAVGMMLRSLTGAPRCAVDVVCANRTRPELRNAVGNVLKIVPVVLDLTAPSFAALLTQTTLVWTQAYGDADFDSRAVRDILAELAAPHGVDFDLPYEFNDMWSRDPGRPPATEPTAAQLSALAKDSTFGWTEHRPRDYVTMSLNIIGSGADMGLSLLADTRRLPPHGIREFLFGLERLMIDLVAGDVALAP